MATESVSGSFIATAGQIGSGVIPLSKLATEVGNANKLYSWNGSGVPTALQFAGLIKMSAQTLGAQATSIDFTSLDINTDGIYLFCVDLISNAAADYYVNLYVNNDTTNGNYYSEEYGASGSTGAVQSDNQPAAVFMRSSANTARSFAWIWVIRSAGGYFHFMTTGSTYDSTNRMNLRNFAGTKSSATVANITQLTFTSAQANGLATGSTITMYKLLR